MIKRDITGRLERHEKKNNHNFKQIYVISHRTSRHQRCDRMCQSKLFYVFAEHYKANKLIVS